MFVPNRRGHATLDCLRIYEASANGAIPVIVGPLQEIAETFKMEMNDGWVVAESWFRAIEIMRMLIANPNALDLKQQILKEWWKNRILGVREKVMKMV